MPPKMANSSFGTAIPQTRLKILACTTEFALASINVECLEDLHIEILLDMVSGRRGVKTMLISCSLNH